MNSSRKQHRRLGRIGAAAVFGVGLVAAPMSNAAALSVRAFAYQVFDCSTPGTDFGVANGTPDKPEGPVRGTTLTANAVRADRSVVAPLKLRTRDDVPDKDIRWATVEPGVEFDHVEFSYGPADQAVILKSPKMKPEVCDGPPLDLPPAALAEALTPVTPVRVLDTRVRSQSVSDPVPAGKTVRLKIGGANGVPGDVGGAMMNVTAANPRGPGFLTVYPCDMARPKTSSINFIAGETRAGAVFTQVAESGEVCVFASATTSVVVDLSGFVVRGGEPGAAIPERIVDTRPGALTDLAGGPKGKQTKMKIPIAELNFVEGADLVVNITTVGADAPGHITVGACDSTPALASGGTRSSVLNYVPGRAQANLAFVYVVDSMCLFATAATHIIVDLVGFVEAPSPLLLSPPLNGRLVDTRAGQKTSDGQFQGGGRLKANVPMKLKVRGRLGMVDATAAALNVTAVAESGFGHVTVYPCNAKVPVASNLNYAPATAIANMALSKLDADGNVCIVSHVDTDLVVDVSGFSSTTIFAEVRGGQLGPDGWGWTPVTEMSIVASKGQTSARRLSGGSPTYTLAGKTVPGLTMNLWWWGSISAKVAGDTYVIAEPIFTLTDAVGHSQRVKVRLMVDPQFYEGLFGIP